MHHAGHSPVLVGHRAQTPYAVRGPHARHSANHQKEQPRNVRNVRALTCLAVAHSVGIAVRGPYEALMRQRYHAALRQAVLRGGRHEAKQQRDSDRNEEVAEKAAPGVLPALPRVVIFPHNAKSKSTKKRSRKKRFAQRGGRHLTLSSNATLEILFG